MQIVLVVNHPPEPPFLALAERFGWHVQTVNVKLSRKQIADLVAFWHPVGLVIDVGFEPSPITGDFGGVPVVYLAWQQSAVPPRAFAVLFDSHATGRIAARELLQLGQGHFAYIHPPDPPEWSDEREAGFGQALAVNGVRHETFRSNRRGLAYQKKLHAFLAGLPKPCSVFAANDEVGADVLTAARVLGLAVPDELSVLGVDDIAAICERTHPTLSSIRPDFAHGDELAALLLLSLLEKGVARVRPQRRRYEPLGVTHRASTRLLAKTDESVTAALDKIAKEACTGLRARDVTRLFPCARPKAEARFRAATGHSILEEIHAVRLARAKNLLAQPSLQIKAIASFCGFANTASLGKFFRKKTGLAMSSWRKRPDR